MRLFSSDKAAIMDRMGIEEGEVISLKWLRAISNAQKK